MTNNIIVSKCLGSLIIFFLTILFGMLPIKLFQYKNTIKLLKLKYITCIINFGAGTLFYTLFTHILPELGKHKKNILCTNENCADYFFYIGFLAIYAIDKMLHYILEKKYNVQKKINIEPYDVIEINNVKHKLVWFLIGSLAVHEFFEGLAIGLEFNISNIWFMVISICLHKCVIAISLTAELIIRNTENIWIFIHILFFSMSTIIGILVGTILHDDCDINVMFTFLLQQISAGVLCYVLFFELFQYKNGIRPFLFVAVGYIFMYLIQYINILI